MKNSALSAIQEFCRLVLALMSMSGGIIISISVSLRLIRISPRSCVYKAAIRPEESRSGILGTTSGSETTSLLCVSLQNRILI